MILFILDLQGQKNINIVALLIASMKTRCSVKWRTWWISHLRFTCSHLCAILLSDFNEQHKNSFNLQIFNHYWHFGFTLHLRENSIKNFLNHVKKNCRIGTLHFEGELITDLNIFLWMWSFFGHVQRLYCSLLHVRFCWREGDAELQHVVQY